MLCACVCCVVRGARVEEECGLISAGSDLRFELTNTGGKPTTTGTNVVEEGGVFISASAAVGDEGGGHTVTVFLGGNAAQLLSQVAYT